MLFDLRSRRRKNAVRVIYSLLAVVMVLGLVLLGVGTGAGGILDSNDSSGSSSVDNSGQVKKAEKAVKDNPSSATDWGNLFHARYLAAVTGSNVKGTYDEPTTSGIKALKQTEPAWNRYVKLAGGKPTARNATFAAYMYADLALFSDKSYWPDAVSAWEYAIQGTSARATKANQYQCLAYTAYAADHTTTAAAAAAKALTLAKALHESTTTRSELKSNFAEAKDSTTDAGELVAEYCSSLDYDV